MGRTIVATFSPHEQAVLETIRELGLELQVIFNKGAVMVLPSGMNKASGLRDGAPGAGPVRRTTWSGIGDAENDHAFLSACECGVAVANALPLLKERADLVTAGDHGAGVVELVRRLAENDLEDLVLPRHLLTLGARDDGTPVHASRRTASTCCWPGTSGSGKSTFATGLLERLRGAGRQFCIVDPEGDYPSLPDAVVLGGPEERAHRGGGARRAGAAGAGRGGEPAGPCRSSSGPAYFERLLSRLLEMRARTGRPHWIVLDEAHHLLPASWDKAPGLVPQTPHGLLFITVHPNKVGAAGAADGRHRDRDRTGLGRDAAQLRRGDGPGARARAPRATSRPGRPRCGAFTAAEPPFVFRADPPKSERKRHVRKYAAGELRPDKSFYFRGAAGKLNLRAQNLQVFLQLAEGVDDETWLHHLARGDYSRWLRDAIRDEALADEVAEVERSGGGRRGEPAAGPAARRGALHRARVAIVRPVARARHAACALASTPPEVAREPSGRQDRVQVEMSVARASQPGAPSARGVPLPSTAIAWGRDLGQMGFEDGPRVPRCGGSSRATTRVHPNGTGWEPGPGGW